jgi:cobalt-zinc-cadmium resistance protein CzcA
VVRPKLRMVPGVADVVSFGGSVKEYQVRVDPYALKKYGVTLDQVSQAVGANGANAGGGLLRRGDEALVVRSIGIFTRLDDIRGTVIASRGGRPILVSDVAEVEIGPRPLSGIVAFNDRDSIVEGIVQMTKGSDAAKVVAELKTRIAEIGSKLPPGVKIRPIYERTQLIHHTVETVLENLAIGALLVMAILVAFLQNWRAALIVGSVIPLALLGAFILMDARGVSANLISLGAVDFGIIIDSAVVLVEALMVKLAVDSANRDYAHRMTTLRQTVVELGHPILFSKAIIIIAFLPIFTFQRVEGKIFSPVALTLSFALAGALVLTLTLVPALLSFAIRHGAMAETHSAWLARLQERYRNLLARVFANWRRVLAASLGVLAMALAGAPLLGTEFLPKLDEGNIWLTINLPSATALQRTKEVERAVRAILLSYPEVKAVITQVGRPDDGTDPKGPNNLEILADLKPRSAWRFATKDDLVADMSARIHAIPGLPTNFSQVIQDNVEEALSGAKGEIVVKVFGPELVVLEDLAGRVVDTLNTVRGATDVGALRIGGQSEVDIQLDRQRLARLGISVGDANSVVQTALAGSAVNAFYDGERRFDVTVRIAKPFRDAVDDIAGLQVALPGGAGTVSLSEIARVEVRQGAARITRESGGRSVAIKVNLRDRDQGGFVAEAQRKVAAAVPLPPGYTLTWGGQFENQQRAAKRLQIIVPISALLIFSLLFWAFRSVQHSLLVLAMVPFTLVGGIAALALAGLHLSVSAAVGFIAVAGISVQNGVIMVEHIVERLRNGAEFAAAVVEGAVARFRPILMTALMAGLGLLPAALSHGIGSETQRPFAAVIVGGIVSGTVFTLLLLPLLFARFGRENAGGGA